MSYRTAAILSVLLVGGMFAISFVTMTAAGRLAEQGLGIPTYERALFDIGFFVATYKWVAAMPIVGTLLLLATVSGKSEARK